MKAIVILIAIFLMACEKTTQITIKALEPVITPAPITSVLTMALA